jgi:ATP-dependent RNA helicase DDX41
MVTQLFQHRYEEYVPLAKRKHLEAQKYRELVGRAGSVSADDEDRAHEEKAENRPKESLLAAAVRMRKDQPEATEEQKQLEEEADILKHVLQKQALKAVKELAQVGCPQL